MHLSAVTEEVTASAQQSADMTEDNFKTSEEAHNMNWKAFPIQQPEILKAS